MLVLEISINVIDFYPWSLYKNGICERYYSLKYKNWVNWGVAENYAHKKVLEIRDNL